VQKVVSTVTSGRRVGLRRVSGNFDDITIAPTGTYADSTIVASKGDIIIVQSIRNSSGDVCQFDISPYIYAKLKIDSIAVDTRTLVVRSLLDPNCGFRSFESGIPTR